MNLHDLVLPERIAQLPRDRRGYPIPFIVMRDDAGEPQFVVNDTRKVYEAMVRKLCGVCGQGLEAEVWFTGGASNALMNGDVGVYVDGPLHEECKTFAMEVCPHLAHRMTKPVNLEPIRRHMGEEGVRLRDASVLPGVPTLFVAVKTARFKPARLEGGLGWKVDKPFLRVEYWRGGQQLPRHEGRAAARDYKASMGVRLLFR